ncbi:MAG: hypothetical protein H6710_16070 [Myxococcales bacterium]|nr:hypothetical protein [Myxococcales bacterium]
MTGEGDDEGEIADDALGDAGLLLPPATLALVILPDNEAAVDLGRPLLGRVPAERLVDDARAAGFTAALVAPGVRSAPVGADEVATGDRVGGPALVALESACIHNEILRLMVEHPLEPDERFTLYDAVGRPTAWFCGDLRQVPAVMPISEEITWPAEVGPGDLARLVYPEDRRRAEAIVRRSRGLGEGDGSVYGRWIAAPLLRALTAADRPVAQVEVAALALAVGSGGLVLVHPWLGALAGALALFAGVEIARQIPPLRHLRAGDRTAFASEVVIRPFGHASYTAALTYVLVADASRSGAADLVLLAIGGAAVVLSLGQARSLLRRQATLPLDLPSSAGLAARLGIRWPARWRAPLVIELLVGALALVGPGLAWGVMVAAGLARLWRWFASPALAEGSGRGR